MTKLKSKKEELDVVIQSPLTDKKSKKELSETKKVTRAGIASMMGKSEFTKDGNGSKLSYKEKQIQLLEQRIAEKEVELKQMLLNKGGFVMAEGKQIKVTEDFIEATIRQLELNKKKLEKLKGIDDEGGSEGENVNNIDEITVAETLNESEKEENNNTGNIEENRGESVEEDNIENIENDSGKIEEHDTDTIKEGNKDSLLTLEHINNSLKYNYIRYLYNGDYEFEIDGKCGVISERGEEIVKPIYDEIKRADKFGYIVRKGDKYGLVDRKGNLILPLKFDDLECHSSKLVTVKLNGKRGIVDKNGKEILPPKLAYDSVTAFNSFISIYKDELEGIINEKGETIIPLKYQWITILGDGYKVKLDGGYGVIDSNGKFIIRPVYGEYMRKYDDCYIVEQDGKYGVLDKRGNSITGIIYEEIDYSGSMGGFIVKQKGKRGFLDKQGKVRISPKYDSIRATNFGTFIVKENSHCSVIDKNGKIVPLDNKLEDIEESYEGYYAKIFGKWGMTDKKGSFIISPEYDEISGIDGKKGKYFKVKQNGKVGLIDRKSGKEIMAADKYDKIEELSQGKYIVKSDGKCGIVDHNGYEIMPLVYDSIREISRRKDLLIVSKDGKCGIISDYGEVLVPLEFDRILSETPYASTLKKDVVIEFSKDGKSGIVYLPGKLRSIKDIVEDLF